MGLDSLHAHPGGRVIYVGELRPGPLMDELDGWTVVESLDLPQWEGITDRLVVLTGPA